MRDLAKSMISWAWAMSVFSALQGARLFSPNGGANDHTATGAFNTVTDAATGLLAAPAKMAWKAGVAAQDAVFHVIEKTAPASTPASEAAPAAATSTSGEPVPIGALASASSAKHES